MVFCLLSLLQPVLGQVWALGVVECFFLDQYVTLVHADSLPRSEDTVDDSATVPYVKK